jgi:hypothetical protein
MTVMNCSMASDATVVSASIAIVNSVSTCRSA